MQQPELDQADAGVDLNQHASFCCVALFCAYIDVIKLKIMKYKLAMSKERYDVLKEEMKDKVIFDRDEINDSISTHWVHFEVVIDDSIDLLDFFHAGFHAGYDQRAKLFPI